MLAGYFVYNGVKSLKDPQEFVAEHEKFANNVVPLAKKVAPAEVSGYLPEDAATLARVSGGMQVVGGLALATGKGRRFGAGLLAASMVPQLMAGNPLKGDRNEILKNLALVGGALIASADTEGKPSVAWLAQDRSRRALHNASQATGELTKSVNKSVNQTLEAAEKSTKKPRGKLKRQAKKARKVAQQRAEEFAKQARKQAKQAQKDGKKQAKRVKKQAKKHS